MAWLSETVSYLGDNIRVMRKGNRYQFPEGMSLSVAGVFYQGSKSFIIESLETFRGEEIIAVAKEIKKNVKSKARRNADSTGDEGISGASDS